MHLPRCRISHPKSHSDQLTVVVADFRIACTFRSRCKIQAIFIAVSQDIGRKDDFKIGSRHRMQCLTVRRLIAALVGCRNGFIQCTDTAFIQLPSTVSSTSGYQQLSLINQSFAVASKYSRALGLAQLLPGHKYQHQPNPAISRLPAMGIIPVGIIIARWLSGILIIVFTCRTMVIAIFTIRGL